MSKVAIGVFTQATKVNETLQELYVDQEEEEVDIEEQKSNAIQ